MYTACIFITGSRISYISLCVAGAEIFTIESSPAFVPGKGTPCPCSSIFRRKMYEQALPQPPTRTAGSRPENVEID